MADLGSVDWPPAPITTERLVLREPEARDGAAIIELLASPEVRAYLGALDNVTSSSARCLRCPLDALASSLSISTER